MKPASENLEVGGYRLQRLLGSGGMSEVWLGIHKDSGGIAAIKLLKADAAEELTHFFAREKRVLLRLRHPNILPVFDVGPDYIATAYVEGSSLLHRMRAPIAPMEALRLARAIGSALSAAHEAGVVHCDVGPSNILVDRAGTPFLIDFGIAQLSIDDSGHALAIEREKLEPNSEVVGTFGYMSPEQVMGFPPTPASDQYALAQTLLAILVGPPFSEDSRQSVESLPVALGDSLREVLRRATAQLPNERYESVSDFVEALERSGLSSRKAPHQLAPVIGEPERFAWALDHDRVERIGASIFKADYSLSKLERLGVLERESVDLFRKYTGQDEFAWTVYFRDERLGDISDPQALARAEDTVVLLHGLFTSKELWREIAIGVLQKNAMALILAPDLLAFGDSTLQSGISGRKITPRQMVLNALHWLDLIGIGRSPTVIMGHSLSATALLCVREHEVGAEVSRICVTPALVSDGFGRLTSWVNSALTFLLGWLPQVAIAPVVRHRFNADPSLRLISQAARDQMAEAAWKLGVRKVASLISPRHEKLAPVADLQNCTVISTSDDPLVPDHLVSQVALRAEIPAERRFRLIYGGHFPQFIDEERPGWAARSVHELVTVIDTVQDLSTARKFVKTG